MADLLAVAPDDGDCLLCAQPWIACMCLAIVDGLDVELRRAVECGDLETAAQVASEIEARGAGRA